MAAEYEHAKSLIREAIQKVRTLKIEAKGYPKKHANANKGRGPRERTYAHVIFRC